MSAIFGIVRFDGVCVSPRDLERMGNTLAHRGPDGRKSVVHGGVGIGHCLMRVNREDLFEAQPLRDHDAELIVAADVRLDNREELAEQFGLSAPQMRDLPDGALVLRAYRTWGEDCAERLLGDFAFAVWDARAGKLLLGRDHMGQRSVHYHRGKDFFAFATEIKALWALPEVPRELSEAQLARYIVMDSSPRPGATLFKDIVGVPGGAVLTLSAAGECSTRRYWEPRDDPLHRDRDEAYYVETYRRILTEAVECRVRRLIGPPALCLSGGYDSAAIAGLCGPIMTAKGRKLITVSSVLPEDDQGPPRCPRRWVELCHRDMPHLDMRYFMRRNENLIANLERDCLAADGIPLNANYITAALFAEASRAGARLVMDGLGGDDTINPRGGGILEHFLRTGQFRRFAAEFGPHLRMSGHSFWQTLRRDIIWPLAPVWARRLWLAASRGFAPAWANSAIAADFAKAQIKAGSFRVADLPGQPRRQIRLRARMQRSVGSWPLSYRRNEANEAAARGLDLTRPLADKRVVEFGLAIPEELYVKSGRNRYLACRALADLYPPEFQTRDRRPDPLEPDFAGMLRAARPLLQTEIERLARSATLRRYVDFEKIRTALGPGAAEAKPVAQLHRMVRTFRVAQYVSWFRGENA